MRSRVSLFLAVLVVAVTSRHAHAQSDRPATVSMNLAAPAIERVKARYFAMDYDGGAAEADRLIKQFPKSRELAAWRVANLARSDRPKEAQASGTALLAANRNDPWGWFAQTFVLEYAAESSVAADVLKASLEAYRRAPRDPSVTWLRAFALNNNGQAEQAASLIDSAAARGPQSQELRTLRASAMFNVATANRKTDEAKADSAFALYARARETDPSDVTAYVFAASRLLNSGRNTEAYTLARRGVALSPGSLTAHQNYWRAIDAMKDRAQAARDSEAIADVEAFLRERGNQPTALLAAGGQYELRKRPDQARALQDRILAEHPTSVSAEWVLVNRYRALRTLQLDTTNRDSTIMPRYRAALWAFLDRPVHNRERLVGDAYRELFGLSDSTTNADTLLRIVRGMVKYEGINPRTVFADGAIRLAERGRDYAEAERIARAGLKAGTARIDGQKEIYETVGDYARAIDWMHSFMYDALGVVFMRQNRLDDAKKQLDHARDLDPQNYKSLYHLGQLAEQRGRLEDAEQYYIKGSLIAMLFTNPNRTALQLLYKKTKGTLDGYDAYLANLAETDRANRKTEIAKSRAAAPAPLKPFQLKTLDGQVIALDSLRGKTAVINNWGMWCGPCVAEMPEFQKLAAQYASDTTVRILTIDNDPNTDELRSWLQKKSYTFTTLLDDGYLNRQDMHTFPTTWFLDKNGRVTFTKTGWSEKLVEEFGWRIDMIKNPGTVP